MRLTEKCWRNLDPWECCGQDKYCQRGCHDEGGCTNGCKVPKMYCKLAKYEDLEEQCIAENQCGIGELLLKWKAFFDDIAELYDYRKAEEQGLLLRLPCKDVIESSGDTVYYIFYDEIVECINCGVSIDFEGKVLIALACDYHIFPYREMIAGIDTDPTDCCTNTTTVLVDEWGKTVFLTREEAESALAEKGGVE